MGRSCSVVPPKITHRQTGHSKVLNADRTQQVIPLPDSGRATVRTAGTFTGRSLSAPALQQIISIKVFTILTRYLHYNRQLNFRQEKKKIFIDLAP